MQGTCKLCLKETDLKKSHIIPKSYGRFIKEGNQKLYSFRKEIDKVETMQDLPSEYLLCNECEKKFSIYENYFSRFMQKFNLTVQRDGAFLNVNDSIKKEKTYTLIKSYFLSLVWRMSISKNPLFVQISLGPYEEKMRILLLSAKPIDEFVFPLYVIDPGTSYFNKKYDMEMEKVLSIPYTDKFAIYKMVIMNFFGFMWWLVITDKDKDVSKQMYGLSSLGVDGTLKIVSNEKFANVFIQKTYDSIVELMPLLGKSINQK